MSEGNKIEGGGFEEKPTKEEMIAMGKEFLEVGEVFSFPGIEPETYAQLKASDEEYPGLDTPIDEKIEKMEKEGIKVVAQKNHNGDIFILPAKSDNIENCILPRDLVISEGMPGNLKKLILVSRARKQ